jgi:hypothetical protein
LPASVLDALRRQLDPGLPVRLEGPAKVSLFTYDNDTFVVQSFLDQPVAVRLTGSFAQIRNLMTEVTLTGNPVAPAFFFMRRSGMPQAPRQYSFDFQIEPHSFVAFRGQK